jgi:hypothetical protein
MEHMAIVFAGPLAEALGRHASPVWNHTAWSLWNPDLKLNYFLSSSDEDIKRTTNIGPRQHRAMEAMFGVLYDVDLNRHTWPAEIPMAKPEFLAALRCLHAFELLSNEFAEVEFVRGIEPMVVCHIYSNLPSGKRLQNYGKSPCSMGKSTKNWQFSIAIC